MNNKKEVWLRGEIIEGISPYLQPAAHAMLQAQEEVNETLSGFPDSLLWKSIAGMATPGFHLKHIAGVQDRLLTYAEGKLLSENQLKYLQNEKSPDKTAGELIATLNIAIQNTIERLKQFSDEDLKAFRGVGRQHLPSTVIGLCFHAAEHTMRHTGQLMVTVKFLKTEI